MQIDRCIEPLTRPLLKERGLAGSQVLTQWANIVGPRLARHAIPEKLAFPKGKKTGGTLTVSVENGFALEFQYMQPAILERLATYFGYSAVSRIAISAATLPAEAPLPARKPRKPAIAMECGQWTDGITDPELRAALASLANTLATT